MEGLGEALEAEEDADGPREPEGEADFVIVYKVVALHRSFSEDEPFVYGELFVPVLAFTMGLQNAVITKISGATIRTTHVTGMVTDIGIELGKFLYRSRLADADPVTGDAGKLRLLAALVGLFFAGGVLGALGYVAAGFPVLVPAALTLLVAAWRPLAADLGFRRSPAP